MKEPLIKVGIVLADELSFTLDGVYKSGRKTYSGVFLACIDNDHIYIGNEWAKQWMFEPVDDVSFFDVHNVVIGIDFHWERHETQRFSGALQLVIEDGRIRLINHVRTEDYLKSVISSEMSAEASLELLKAHAIISRGWLLSPILQPSVPTTRIEKYDDSPDRIIKWYERDMHSNFDVCADDHCQRYQGILRVSTTSVNEAIRLTRGMVLVKGDTLCDARYFKACGGVTERFDSCWADQDVSYLQPVRDVVNHKEFPDLTLEKNAQAWIRSSPEAFCNTTDVKVLNQVLNNYDQETADFFRWEVCYTQDELSDLIQRKSGIDVGQVLNLVVVRRGASARIVELKIVGSKRTVVVGKELEIRKWLSESHLYSSAFVVDTLPKGVALPQLFILRGAGWGHGVGLCQVGAAMMGEKGYTYKQILKHYFNNATIRKVY
jgi:stage II sporulation protein D